MTRRLRSLLCSLTGHRWLITPANRTYLPWDALFKTCVRCGVKRLGQQPVSPPTRPEWSPPIGWTPEEAGRYKASLRGTAATAPDVPVDTPEGSTPQPVPYFAKVTGADGASMYLPVGDSSSFTWSTGAPVRTDDSSTSTATPSSGSLPSHGES